MFFNMVLFFRNVLGEGSGAAANDTNNWLGTMFLSSLLGSFIAESYLGRLWACALFQSIALTVKFKPLFVHRQTSHAPLFKCIWSHLNFLSLLAGNWRQSSKPCYLLWSCNVFYSRWPRKLSVLMFLAWKLLWLNSLNIANEPKENNGLLYFRLSRSMFGWLMYIYLAHFMS